MELVVHDQDGQNMKSLPVCMVNIMKEDVMTQLVSPRSSLKMLGTLEGSVPLEVSFSMVDVLTPLQIG